MSLIKWTPTSIEPFEELENFFDWPAIRPASFALAVDIWQDKENVYVESPLAGVNPENVAVSVENDILTIEGKSEKKSEMEEKNYYRKEVRAGSFHRSVALPASVDGSKAKAEFENGVLKVIIPKEERAKSKIVKVEIKK
jgi:HSP20 family protein